MLGHINTAEGKRYTAKTADSFLIELPTNISVVPNKPQRDTVEDKFYFLAQSEGFPRYCRLLSIFVLDLVIFAGAMT